MAGAIWVHGETTADGGLANISAEVATLARTLGEAAGSRSRRASSSRPIRLPPRRSSLATSRACSRSRRPATADHAAATIVAERLAALIERDQPAYVFAGAGPEGRDVAGVVSALTRLGRARQRDRRDLGRGAGRRDERVRRQAQHDEPVHRRAGDRHGPAQRRHCRTGGVCRHRRTGRRRPASSKLPQVKVVDRVEEAGAAAPIEEARIIVSGGRGVGSPDGFKLVEELAEALGGAVGATRAAVDAGWIPYAQQIGQTGKIVKPQLYLALGISGAIQHKVGMQTAETIVAVNRDPDAPIAEFADLVVIGDLFEVAPALLAELRARARLSERARGATDGVGDRPADPGVLVLAALFVARSCVGPAGSIAATRDVERFRRQVGDLAARIETSLGEICARVDAVRRGQLRRRRVVDDIDRIARRRRASMPTRRAALHPPADGGRIRDEIVAELERAKRALEMIEHGVSIQASARSGGARSRPRPRSSAATSTCSMPARRSPVTPPTRRRSSRPTRRTVAVQPVGLIA